VRIHLRSPFRFSFVAVLWVLVAGVSSAQFELPFVELPGSSVSEFQLESSLDDLSTSSSDQVFEAKPTINLDSADFSQSWSDGLDLGDLQLDERSLALREQPLLERLWSDQQNFYSSESLVGLAALFGAGAIMANTQADQQLQNHFQSSVRGATSDEWFEFLHANKELGNGVYVLPVMGVAWIADEYLTSSPYLDGAGLWGERSIRAFLVGAPPLLLMQQMTGGSRPTETLEDSEWHPLHDNNGVSGHAFMSSLPFITAAKMTENPWEKGFWYAASTLGPLSRVNDNAHYPSQVGLGWGLAFLAATAVAQSDTGKRPFRFLPHAPSGDNGFALQLQW
jgi:hypothetical protein